METLHVSPMGALLFIVISLAYVILYFIVQFKVFNRRIKSAENFCEQAVQDERMVTAHRRGFRSVPYDSKKRSYRYVGKYIYSAPNGKQYKMRWWDPDCRFAHIPPDDMVLYLEKRNYRKYYTQQSLSTGKHGPVFQLLFLISGFLLYLLLFDKAISPLLFL